MAKYSHILSPLKVQNRILKSRFLAPKGVPAGLAGGFDFPTDPYITHMANIAKNGAAIVSCHGGHWSRMPKMSMENSVWFETIRNKTGITFPHSDIDLSMNCFHIEKMANMNAWSQMAEAIHYYDSLASISMMDIEPDGYNLVTIDSMDPKLGGDVYRYRPGPGMTTQQLDDLIENFVEKAVLYKHLGYDMVSFYMSYRGSILAQSLSPAINNRADKYGGSFENRARLTLDLFKRVKEVCGQDFLIEAQITGEEASDGYNVDDFIRYAKMAEGLVDIFQIRAYDGKSSHPTGLNSEKDEPPITLQYAQAIKDAGIKIITAPIGGYQDLDKADRYIAEGKTDMIAACRAFICDSEYYKKAKAGLGDDVVPCIRCNKCHSNDDPLQAVCSVNPTVGIADKLTRLVEPAVTKKKVAIIGGGPAGLRASIYCADRGHDVTLYEKNDYLGGQLIHADYASFKWPLKDFKDYLIRAATRRGVKLNVGVEATPEIVKAGAYDVIIAANGASPNKPRIKGADEVKTWAPIDVYGKEDQLGQRVVVVGGAETGSETALHLALKGKDVTILCRQERLAYDAQQIHYVSVLYDRMEECPNFKSICKATTTEVGQGYVTYTDEKGQSHSIPCDDIVLSGGVKANTDNALAFASLAEEYYVIGDCRKPSNVHNANRTAFAVASRI